MEYLSIAGIIVGSLLLFMVFLYVVPLGLWLQALVSGIRISLLELIFMRMRKVPPVIIVSALIESTKAGLRVKRDELEAHYLAGGNISKVINELITTNISGKELSFKEAAMEDLAGIDVESIINKYKLIPHPEGGYYKEVYRSEQEIDSKIINEKRNALTHIYFLLKEGQISRFHRVWHDEIWNFYEGSPLKLIEFDGEEIQEKMIGIDKSYAYVIKGGNYQAAETTGLYTLVGCSVAPGFNFKDFTFLTNDPNTKLKLRKDQKMYMKYI